MRKKRVSISPSKHWQMCHLAWPWSVTCQLISWLGRLTGPDMVWCTPMQATILDKPEWPLWWLDMIYSVKQGPTLQQLSSGKPSNRAPQPRQCSCVASALTIWLRLVGSRKWSPDQWPNQLSFTNLLTTPKDSIRILYLRTCDQRPQLPSKWRLRSTTSSVRRPQIGVWLNWEGKTLLVECAEPLFSTKCLLKVLWR